MKFHYYFFLSQIRVVKEEIIEDSSHLPCFNGRVVSWLVSAEGSNQSDGGSQCTDSVTHQSESRLPPQAPESVCTDTESIISSRQGRRHHKYSSRINGHLPR